MLLVASCSDPLWLRGFRPICYFGKGVLLCPPVSLSGNAIQRFRYVKGLSLSDLAEKTGLTKSYLSKIERGSRRGSPHSAKVIADALGVDVEDIATIEVERESA